MLALSFTFPAGRYHATPWERHVNEGAVAWPPEPWRIVRGLIATWHHKVKHNDQYDESTLLGLIESLATEEPEYHLPAASHSHTRHYLPQAHYKGKFDAKNTSLVLDAFVATERDDPLTMRWPTLELPADQQRLLDELLSVMGYLGRAESWVEAERVTATVKSNCKPGNETVDRETGELKGEAVALFAPLSKDDYADIRKRFLVDKKTEKKLGQTLPDNLLDALSLDTADLRKHGWNQPPAARKISYLRPVEALLPQRTIQTTAPPRITEISFMLVGKPPPHVEDTLRIGELLRIAVMSRAKKVFGENQIPAIFSGHGMPENNRHGHAFYLPWDSTGDGHIDRISLHVPDGMDAAQQRAAAQVRKLWSRDGGQWRLIVENLGGMAAAGPLAQRSRVWISITPYLHPWHCKKRFGIEDQIRRECRERDLPEPIYIDFHETIKVGHQQRRAIHFRRFRSRRGLTQPDHLGTFCQLTFAEPMQGPVALGFACHFGLGLFRPLG